MYFIAALPLPVLSATKSDLVKAGIVQKLSRFIRWSDDNNQCNNEKVYPVLFYGDSPLTTTLHDLLATTDGYDAKKVTSVEEISPCSMLVLAELDSTALASLVELAVERSVITVSDNEGYGTSGVILNLYILNNKVKFEINQRMAEKSKISVSYKLLQLAKIVD